jgi:hypothetical protein
MMIDTTTATAPRSPRAMISAAEYDVKFAREALLDIRMTGTRTELLAAQQKFEFARARLARLIAANR